MRVRVNDIALSGAVRRNILSSLVGRSRSLLERHQRNYSALRRMMLVLIVGLSVMVLMALMNPAWITSVTAEESVRSLRGDCRHLSVRFPLISWRRRFDVAELYDVPVSV